MTSKQQWDMYEAVYGGSGATDDQIAYRLQHLREELDVDDSDMDDDSYHGKEDWHADDHEDDTRPNYKHKNTAAENLAQTRRRWKRQLDARYRLQTGGLRPTSKPAYVQMSAVVEKPDGINWVFDQSKFHDSAISRRLYSVRKEDPAPHLSRSVKQQARKHGYSYMKIMGISWQKIESENIKWTWGKLKYITTLAPSNFITNNIVKQYKLSSPLNGNNGEWTNADDVEIKKTTYPVGVPPPRRQNSTSPVKQEHAKTPKAARLFVKDFKIPSSLNGNNGEWTNADDVGPSNAKVNNKNAQQRLHKKHHEEGAAKPNHPIGVPIKKEQVKSAGESAGKLKKDTTSSSRDQSAHPTEKTKTTVILCAADTSRGIRYCGKDIRDDTFEFTEAPVGAMFDNITEVGYGYMLMVKNKGEEHSLLSCIQMTRGIEVFIPAWRALTTEMQTKLFNPQFMDGCRVFIAKRFGCPLQEELRVLLANTVELFFQVTKEQHSHCVDTALMQSGMLVTLDAPYPGPMYDQLGIIEEGKPRRVDSVPNMMSLNYDVKPILTKVTYCYKDEKVTYNKPLIDRDGGITSKVVMFKFLDNYEKSFYKTQYFDLKGVRPFVQWDNSGRTMLSAVRRIIGARENELFLNTNQLNMYVLLLLEDKIFSIDKDRMNASKFLNLEKNEHQAFIMLGIDRLIGLCNRSRFSILDKLIRLGDKCQNLGVFVSEAIVEAHDYYNPWYVRTTVANLPHSRRNLRRRYVNGQIVQTSVDIMTTRVCGKVKNETAKSTPQGMPSKPARLFVSYEAGCMYAPQLPEYIKICIGGIHKFKHNGVDVDIWILSKDTGTLLREALNWICLAPGRRDYCAILIYSDDSVYGGCINDRPFYYNVDIKSCDSSNGQLVFGVVHKLLANFSRNFADGLVRQCFLPITLVNPSCTYERLKLELCRAFEGSGTVLTTILNHVASYLIAVSVVFMLSEHEDIPRLVAQGAATVGHLVTCEECECIEQIQFLKYSPMRSTDGDIIPVRNFGAILRNLGKIDGDLTHIKLGVSITDFNSMPCHERMDRYFGGVINSYVHEPKSAILESLRQRFPSHGKTFDPLFHETVDLSTIIVDPASIANRYPLYYRVDELVVAISNLNVGTTVTSDLLTDIYHKDYQL